MASPAQILTLPLRLGLKLAHGAIRSVSGHSRSEPVAPPREPAVGPPRPRVAADERPPSRREPWEGYEGMRADEIVARLREAGPDVIAVVERYEPAHKDRKSVLQAAGRRRRQLSV